MTLYATTESVRNLRVGDEIVTAEAKSGSGKVLKSYPVKTIDPCHHDSYSKYIHVNGNQCFTLAGKVRVGR